MKTDIAKFRVLLGGVLLYGLICVAGWANPGLRQIDDVAGLEIADGNIPGAVVLVGQADEVLYHKAFGNAVTVPARRDMTRETVFDLASLTRSRTRSSTSPPT